MNSALDTHVDKKVITVILNERSGLDQKEDAQEVIRHALAADGSELDIRRIGEGTDLCELTREIMKEGADVIVAAGGDGTVNAVASVLTGTNTALGVLPVGTLNHFARDLQIPLELPQAAEVIAEDHSLLVDVGEVNDKHFINNAIIGLYPAYRFQREHHQRKGRFKWLAMLSALWGVFRVNPALRLRIESGGESLDRITPFLMIANNRHRMEGYELGNRSSLQTGKLCVYVMHRLSRWGLLGLAVRVILGRFSKRRDFDVFDARSVTVESRRRKIGVSLDGEVVRMSTPLHFRSAPQALRVIVPKDYAPGSR